MLVPTVPLLADGGHYTYVDSHCNLLHFPSYALGVCGSNALLPGWLVLSIT